MAGTTDSVTYEVESAPLTGLTLFDLVDTNLFAETYTYTAGDRTEELEIQGSLRHYLTQTNAEWYASTNGTRSIAVTLVFPFGEDHDTRVRSLRNIVRARRVLGYRDNRSRLQAGVISDLQIADVKHGSEASFTFNVVNYPGVN